MTDPMSSLLWTAGKPVRSALVWLIKGYRASFGLVLGGRCRFYPSCSAYAEAAVAQVGVVRGLSLAAWRVLRCSPLSKGGVDYPPSGRGAGSAGLPVREPSGSRVYDADIHRRTGSQMVGGGPQ